MRPPRHHRCSPPPLPPALHSRPVHVDPPSTNENQFTSVFNYATDKEEKAKEDFIDREFTPSRRLELREFCQIKLANTNPLWPTYTLASSAVQNIRYIVSKVRDNISLVGIGEEQDIMLRNKCNYYLNVK